MCLRWKGRRLEFEWKYFTRSNRSLAVPVPFSDRILGPIIPKSVSLYDSKVVVTRYYGRLDICTHKIKSKINFSQLVITSYKGKKKNFQKHKDVLGHFACFQICYPTAGKCTVIL